MDSDNPFLLRLHAVEGAVDAWEVVTDRENSVYYLSGEKYKFSKPEAFRFIDYKVRFIAFSLTPESKVNSLVFIIHHQFTEVLDIFSLAFGQPDLQLAIEGDVHLDDRTSGNAQYKSYTWKDGKHMMTLSPWQEKNESVNAPVMSRIHVRS